MTMRITCILRFAATALAALLFSCAGTAHDSRDASSGSAASHSKAGASGRDARRPDSGAGAVERTRFRNREGDGSCDQTELAGLSEPIRVTAEATAASETEALKKARELAVEKAGGIYYERFALVSDGRLVADVREYIWREHIVQQTVKHSSGPAGHTVRIIALVKPLRPEPGAIAVRLALSSHQFQSGDPLRIRYRADADGYAYLIAVSADCAPCMLLPNRKMPDHRVRKGEWREFPPGDSRIPLLAHFPEGHPRNPARAWIKLIVTREPADFLASGIQECWAKSYDARRALRFKDLLQRFAQIGAAAWGEATASCTIAR